MGRSLVLPHESSRVFLTDGGLETEFIYRRGIELPQFSSIVLHDSPEYEKELRDYLYGYVDAAERGGYALVLDTATWRASRPWCAALGYSPAEMERLNRRAVMFLQEFRDEVPIDVVLSGCVGPVGDAYASYGPASADDAFRVHTDQVEVLAEAGVDVISALTLTNATEAIGIVRAAQANSVPVVVSFTVETDGCLPNGMTLSEAITAVDHATASAPAYFMVNCAHVTHFEDRLSDAHPALDRIRGVRANASMLSHAELDDLETIDDGDPDEFGAQLARLHRDRPSINVLGGCCGTDVRHISSITERLKGS